MCGQLRRSQLNVRMYISQGGQFQSTRYLNTPQGTLIVSTTVKRLQGRAIKAPGTHLGGVLYTRPEFSTKEPATSNDNSSTFETGIRNTTVDASRAPFPRLPPALAEPPCCKNQNHSAHICKCTSHTHTWEHDTHTHTYIQTHTHIQTQTHIHIHIHNTHTYTYTQHTYIYTSQHTTYIHNHTQIQREVHIRKYTFIQHTNRNIHA